MSGTGGGGSGGCIAGMRCDPEMEISYQRLVTKSDGRGCVVGPISRASMPNA
jgi:hypothetical protein